MNLSNTCSYWILLGIHIPTYLEEMLRLIRIKGGKFFEFKTTRSDDDDEHWNGTWNVLHFTYVNCMYFDQLQFSKVQKT
jgi:hypothetical protein